MPFRPWGFCGGPPPRPGLVGILWGQEHAARQDIPAARSTPATPTARRPGQHLTAVRTSAPPRFLRGHRCCLRSAGTCMPCSDPAAPGIKTAATGHQAAALPPASRQETLTTDPADACQHPEQAAPSPAQAPSHGGSPRPGYHRRPARAEPCRLCPYQGGAGGPYADVQNVRLGGRRSG
jgi:hypothetical protein